MLSEQVAPAGAMRRCSGSISYLLAPLAVVLLLASACATPVGVSVESTQDVYRTLTRNVLSADKLSAQSEQMLRRLGLDERFAKNPEEVIKELRGDGTNLGRDRLFTLAEMSFLYAETSDLHDHYLAAAVYAYA